MPQRKRSSWNRPVTKRRLVRALRPFANFVEAGASHPSLGNDHYSFGVGTVAKLTKRDFDELHKLYLLLKAYDVE